MQFGDVDYYDEEFPFEGTRHEEALEWEEKVRSIAEKVGLDPNCFRENTDALFDPIFALATRHKHCGFKEEREVRIVTVVLNDSQIRSLGGNGEAAGEGYGVRKVIYEHQHGEGKVSRIELFDATPLQGRTLPIKEIVVGPHPDKFARKERVIGLLDRLGIQASVRVSDIPYVEK